MSKWTRVAGVVVVSLVLCTYLCSSAMAFNIIQLTGQVWYDTNSNGVIDAANGASPAEAGINGVTVQLWNGTTLVGTKTTASLDPLYESGTPTQDGWYVFTGLTANTTYTVVVTDDAGALAGYTETYDISTPTDDDTATVPVATTSVQRVDFGYVAPAAAADYGISGTVWYDVYQDGVVQGSVIGERGFNGVTVTLYAGATATGTPIATTTTYNYADSGNPLSDGFYMFQGLTQGVYTVVVSAGTGTPLAGFTQTYDVTSPKTDNMANSVPVGPAGNATQVNFGYYAPPPPDKRPFTTYTQGGWGTAPKGNNPGTVLHKGWSAVYPAGLSVGGTYFMKFVTADDVTNFLPAGGTAGKLTRSYTAPTSTSAGVLAGQVLSVRLGLDFSAAGVTRSGLSALKIQSGPYKGWSVGSFESLCEQYLGGNVSANASDLNATATAINENFDNGTVDHGYLK